MLNMDFFLLGAFFLMTAVEFSHGAGCGDDTWTPYKTSKCFKVIKRSVTRAEADSICNREAPSNDKSNPSSLTIKSEEEQLFLTDLIFNKAGVIDNVWIGAKRKDNTLSFVWPDNTMVEYTNWDMGNPSNDPEKQCVQMRPREGMEKLDGKWNDVACTQKIAVVCQKLQESSTQQLEKDVMQLKEDLATAQKRVQKVESDLANSNKQIQTNKNEIASAHQKIDKTNENVDALKTSVQDLQKKKVPIGYIYTQYYNHPAPNSIWPEYSWTEVTSTYAGQFFRAAGGNAASFGTVQPENIPRIEKVSTDTKKGDSTAITIPTSGTSKSLLYSGGTMPYSMKFESSSGEVRPRNQAIKLWKRTS